MTESTAGTEGSSSRLTWRLIHHQSSHSRLHPCRCLYSPRAIQRFHRQCRATSPGEIWNQRRFPYQFPLLPDQHESSASRSVSATKDVRTGGQEEPHYKANEELIKDKAEEHTWLSISLFIICILFHVFYLLRIYIYVYVFYNDHFVYRFSLN